MSPTDVDGANHRVILPIPIVDTAEIIEFSLAKQSIDF